MLDEFLKVAYATDSKKQSDDELVAMLRQLPQADLQKVAAGVPIRALSGTMAKIASFDDTSFLDKFKGTPLFEQAVALEQQEVQLSMKSQEESAAKRQMEQQQPPTFEATDRIRLQKRLLEIDLAKTMEAAATGGMGSNPMPGPPELGGEAGQAPAPDPAAAAMPMPGGPMDAGGPKMAFAVTPRGHEFDAEHYQLLADQAAQRGSLMHAYGSMGSAANHNPNVMDALRFDAMGPNSQHPMVEARHNEYAAKAHAAGRNAWNPFGGMLTPSSHEEGGDANLLGSPKDTHKFKHKKPSGAKADDGGDVIATMPVEKAAFALACMEVLKTAAPLTPATVGARAGALMAKNAGLGQSLLNAGQSVVGAAVKNPRMAGVVGAGIGAGAGALAGGPDHRLSGALGGAALGAGAGYGGGMLARGALTRAAPLVGGGMAPGAALRQGAKETAGNAWQGAKNWVGGGVKMSAPLGMLARAGELAAHSTALLGAGIGAAGGAILGGQDHRIAGALGGAAAGGALGHGGGKLLPGIQQRMGQGSGLLQAAKNTAGSAAQGVAERRVPSALAAPASMAKKVVERADPRVLSMGHPSGLLQAPNLQDFARKRLGTGTPIMTG